MNIHANSQTTLGYPVKTSQAATSYTDRGINWQFI
mgnify:CR=1 FL=1